MRSGWLRYSIVAVSAGCLAIAGLPAAGAGAATSGQPPIGDRCFVGTWHDNGGRTTTRWLGKTVVMHAGGGDYDHISNSGADRDGWSASKPLVGKVAGHRLKERVRGNNHLLIRVHRSGHGGTVTLTEQGWGPKSTNRYLYRGKHSKGYLNQTGTFSYGFRCTLTTLTFLGPKGHVLSTETRVSYKP
jgi:hypothetical protein